MAVICVDLSRYQQGFDFAAYKASGGLGVILKATEGTTIKDSSYETFRAQAQAAGLAVATYHFFRPSDPTQQADFYLDVAQPEQGERVVCDFEDANTTIDDMIAFFKRIQAHRPDLQLTVYSGHLIKDDLGLKTNAYLADNTSLWLAQYTTGSPSWPAQVWPQWSLWQYSDQNKVPGFNDAVDTNRFNGSDEQFLKWMGPAETGSGEVTAELPIVTITVSSDTPIKLRINADGDNIELPWS